MKYLSLIIMVVSIFAFSNIDAQTVVTVDGPEDCPNSGYLDGDRPDGPAIQLSYYGYTGGPGPSLYHQYWTQNVDLYDILTSTASVQTGEGYAMYAGYYQLVTCAGSDTRLIGYNYNLTFNITLQMSAVGTPHPGDPPPED